MPPERNEDVAQIVVGFRVVGFEGNGLPMAGDGLLAAAQVGERIAEVAVRLGEVGLEFDGAPKARERLFGLFIAPSSAVPQVVVRAGELRLQRERPFDQLDALGRLPPRDSTATPKGAGQQSRWARR
jgi:hypothetical protein